MKGIWRGFIRLVRNHVGAILGTLRTTGATLGGRDDERIRLGRPTTTRTTHFRIRDTSVRQSIQRRLEFADLIFLVRDGRLDRSRDIGDCDVALHTILFCWIV